MSYSGYMSLDTHFPSSARRNPLGIRDKEICNANAAPKKKRFALAAAAEKHVISALDTVGWQREIPLSNLVRSLPLFVYYRVSASKVISNDSSEGSFPSDLTARSFTPSA